MNRLSLLLTLSLGLSAGTPAQLAGVSMSVTTAKAQPVIEISNKNDLPIEGLLITVDVTRKGNRLTRIYFDPYVNYKRDLPIASGGSQEFPLPHMIGGAEPVATLRAVVFSGGTTAGDQVWIDELLDRRKIVADRLREVLDIVREISDRNLSKEEATALLQQARQARAQATVSRSLEEQLLHDDIFQDVIGSLDPPMSVNGNPPVFSKVVKSVDRSFGRWLAYVESAKPSSPEPTAKAPN